MPTILLMIAFTIGLLIPVQGAANAQLGHVIGHPTLAASFSLAIGLFSMCLVLPVLGASWTKLDAVTGAPSWMWSGGLIGAAFVTAAILLIPRVGAAPFATAVMAGQIISAILMDRFGLLGLPHRAISGWKYAGFAFVALGLVAVAIDAWRSDQFNILQSRKGATK
ncbi:MAG: DMT family transporter [Sphingomonadales bacterium]|nr:DMT family transporter [Sphingomonadales bacterium]